MPGFRRSLSTAESRAALRESRAALIDPAPVMDAAAVFLGVRPRSVAETRQRLLHLGYPEGLVGGVLERLIEMNYLGDVAFARAWVESRDRARPRGENALRRELAMKGVPREVVDRVLAARLTEAGAGATDPNRAAADALLARRRASFEREPDLARRRQKAYALLARNGFDPETCREATTSFATE
ncbi:MAG: regulatory protein RecX [Candidatus Limnocylindrales bacterium]